MNEMIFSFTIQGDSEGYVSFECPFCCSEFKLQAREYQDNENPLEDLYCPYCGLTREKSSFLSSDVRQQVRTLAENYMIEEINKAFGKMKRSVNSSKGLLKMTFKPLKKVTIKELKNNDTVETEFMCSCCERRLKVLYCAGVAKIFCPYCGVDI